MPGKRTPRRKATAAQIAKSDARREELTTKLADGIDALVTSDAWLAYLKCQAQFHRYSFQNTMMIMSQMPTATHVNSFARWIKLDRHVRKGATSVRIWGPVTGKTRTVTTAEGEEEKRNSFQGRFVLVPVFDISQTDGEPLAEHPCRLLDGDDEAGTFGALVSVAEGMGWSVESPAEIDGYPGANGLCRHGPNVLEVASDRSGVQQVKTLAHELGHALLHGTDAQNRGLKELEAESVAYVVCASLGIATEGYSFGYVASWANGDAEKARKLIKESGKRIQAAAKTILDGLDKQAEPVKAPEYELEADLAA